MLESGDAKPLFILAGLDGVVVFGNRDISVSGQAVLLVGVGDTDRWTVLISQKRGLGGMRPGSLRDVINGGIGWLQVVISDIQQQVRKTGADLGGVHRW